VLTTRARSVRRAAVILALAVPIALACQSAQAQFGGMGGMGSEFASMPVKTYPVKVETNGGAVTGTLNLASVNIHCALGAYAIVPSKVKEVRFASPVNENDVRYGPGPAEVPAVVVTRAGDEIRGRVVVQFWQVKTDLGVLTLNPVTLKSIAITGEAAEPEQLPPAELKMPKKPKEAAKDEENHGPPAAPKPEK
jgi:hypothetical protein